MFTPGTRKARSRSRRNAARWTAKPIAAPTPDDTPDGFDASPMHDDAPEFDVEDDFVLGADDVFITFAGNDTPPPETVLELTREAEQPEGPPPLAAAHDLEEDAPFDAPEEDDEIFQERRIIEAPAQAGELLLTASAAVNAQAAHPAQAGGDASQPVPAISIYASHDSETAGELFTQLAADPRLRRGAFAFGRGGIDGAAARVAKAGAPDLFVLESTLQGADMLRALDELAPAVAQGAKIVLLGAVNDIGLLRELAARGVSEYIVPPITAAELAASLCRLYANTDNARVIAVIGARGGVGASTVAHNIAWSIAERQQQATAIVDLDFAFGTAAFNFHQTAPHTMGDAFAAPDRADDELIDKLIIRQTPRLRIFSAPVTLEREFRPTGETLDAVLKKIRRTAGYIVLDLPHMWSPWVKEALLAADETVLVTGPDLASLSSAKSMIETLRDARPGMSPHVVMSMVGVPKRPEIALKEFAGALGVEPALALAFEPALFGQAAIAGQSLGAVAPHAKAAVALDQLASAITGREPCEAPAGETASAPAPQLSQQPAAPSLASDETVHGALKRLRVSRTATAAASDAFIDKARMVASGKVKRARRPSTALRATAALTTLFVVSAWFIENHRPSAQAVELVAATAAPVAATAPVQPPPAAAPAISFEAALRMLEEGRAGEAVAALQSLAETGSNEAQHRLAKLYETGEGVEADLSAARRWTERAALAGNPHAMHDLGVYFARGEGVAIDPVAAFRWFRQAAERGVADSQYNLGVLYDQGRGVTADPAEALFWFTLAAQQGDETAGARAAEIAERLTPMALEQARARAAAFEPQRSQS
ncbi:MAG TPA: AAA family ATPase [Vitreimonas sp.]|uniref:AAA family ATPase n=1 Tax=Vitreimonas sp. TaxID=3069702 RepID=UPI002D672E77|nr:AAA family ATPase [Vitreimonas sp.]HYD88380.1 AAA family ATPase [Vitreimonas sp.]